MAASSRPMSQAPFCPWFDSPCLVPTWKINQCYGLSPLIWFYYSWNVLLVDFHARFYLYISFSSSSQFLISECPGECGNLKLNHKHGQGQNLLLLHAYHAYYGSISDMITSEPQEFLAKNWSITSSICDWIGVTCSSRHVEWLPYIFQTWTFLGVPYLLNLGICPFSFPLTLAETISL